MVANGQHKAKKWWKRYWCRERGRSALAYVPQGGCRTNSPIEGGIKQMKLGTQGHMGLSCGMKLGHYVVVSFFICGCRPCCTMHKRPDGVSCCPSNPRLSPAQWHAVETMHPLTMAMACSTKNRQDFSDNMQKLFSERMRATGVEGGHVRLSYSRM